MAKAVKQAVDANKTMPLPGVQHWFSTGCTVLDLALSNRLDGGVPAGRVIHVFGAGSTCKSVLACTTAGYAQRRGQFAHYLDVEQTLDTDFAKLFGLNVDDASTLATGYPTTLEDLFDNHIKNILATKKDKPQFVAIDSISALPSVVETEEAMDKGSFGATRAKQMSRAFRKYHFALANAGITLFCIDQTRDAINSMFAKEVTSGGRALEFFSSVQIYLRHDSKILNNKDVPIGIWVKFRIDKNKVAPPLREGRFKILFDYGIDDIASNLYFLSECQNGPQNAKKKSTTIAFNGEEKKMSTWINEIEENNLEETLRQEVYKTWQELYSNTEQRKPRVYE